MLEICSPFFLHSRSEVFTSIYALSLKKLSRMLTLVPGQGQNPSPATKQHGDFTDFTHWFPGAPQKWVFHHGLAGAALNPPVISDRCCSVPGMVRSQGRVPSPACPPCLLKHQLSQIWREQWCVSVFMPEVKNAVVLLQMHEDLHPLTLGSHLDRRLLLLLSQLLKIDGSWEIMRSD